MIHRKRKETDDFILKKRGRGDQGVLNFFKEKRETSYHLECPWLTDLFLATQEK